MLCGRRFVLPGCVQLQPVAGTGFARGTEATAGQGSKPERRVQTLRRCRRLLRPGRAQPGRASASLAATSFDKGSRARTSTGRSIGKPRESQGKTKGNPMENLGKQMEILGKTKGEPKEGRGKTLKPMESQLENNGKQKETAFGDQ